MREDSITWGLSSLHEICPGLGAGSEVHLGDLEDLGLIVVEELQLFREFIDEWNQNQQKPTASLLLETILGDPRFFA
jgi:hypothetical protein